jgi:hypothetical protein
MSHVPYDSTGEQPANVPRTDGAGRGSRSRSLDEIFKLLTDRRRREALYVLNRREEPITVTRLAEEVAAVTDAGPERVAISLHHVHLPKLDAASIVEHDAEAGTVRLVDASDRFHRYLHIAAMDEERFIGPVDEEVASDERDAPQSES